MISARSWVYYENILDDGNDVKKQFQLLNHLRKLDILSYPGIEIEKDTNFDIENTSSGEYHFLLSFLGILSRIEENSLILLDEPDISLHPNWQMKYVGTLKQIFSDYKSCHFMLATHSHFIVSDLEPKTSSLIALKRDEDNIVKRTELPKSTYGWSAENVLYNVFNLRSVRNYYFEQNIRELLLLISSKSDDFNKIGNLVEKLDSFTLNKEDPLNIVLNRAKRYLDKNA